MNCWLMCFALILPFKKMFLYFHNEQLIHGIAYNNMNPFIKYLLRIPNF